MKSNEPGKILFRCFLRKATVGSSGMGRNVHSLTLSIQHFLCRPRRLPPSKMPWRMFGETVVARDMHEPCTFPSLDSCQKRYLWAHKEVPSPHKPRTNKDCLKSHIQKSSQSGRNTGHRITNGSWLTVLDTAQSRAYVPSQVLWSAELSVYPGKQLHVNEPTVLVQLCPHPSLLVLHSSMSENQRKRLRVFHILNFNYVSLLITIFLVLFIYLFIGRTHKRPKKKSTTMTTTMT